jgi:hypothetical protein
MNQDRIEILKRGILVMVVWFLKLQGRAQPHTTPFGQVVGLNSKFGGFPR